MIVMDLFPQGSLHALLQSDRRDQLTAGLVMVLARDILSGLAFLHSRQLVHRDIKPEVCHLMDGYRSMSSLKNILLWHDGVTLRGKVTGNA